MLGLPSMLPLLFLHYCPSFNYPVREPGQMTQCVQDSSSANQITTHDVQVSVFLHVCKQFSKGCPGNEKTKVCFSCLLWFSFLIFLLVSRSTCDLLHSRMEQPAEWRRAEQCGGGLAEWHHAGIIDYCPVTMAEEEKQIRLCVIVCTCVRVYVWHSLRIWNVHVIERADQTHAASQILSVVCRFCGTLTSTRLALTWIWSWRLFFNRPILLFFSFHHFFFKLMISK